MEVSPGQHQLLLCPHPVCPHIGYGLQLQVLKTCSLPVISWKLQHLQGLPGNPWHLSMICWTISCCLNIWVGKVSRRRWNKQRTSSKHYRKPTTQVVRGVPQDQGTANSSRVQVFWCNMQAAATRKTDINLRRSNTGHLRWCWSGTLSERRSNTASTPSSNWWTFPLCFVKRQTGDTSLVQHWLIQDTFQQSSLSFKNQVQDAETEIIQNAPVWLSLCGLDFFICSTWCTRQIRMHLLTASPCNRWTVPVFPKHHWLVHPHRRKFSGCKQATQTLLK